MLYLLNDMSNEATAVAIAVLFHSLSAYLNRLFISFLADENSGRSTLCRVMGAGAVVLKDWAANSYIGSVGGLMMHEW